jgi:hypothetical protein
MFFANKTPPPPPPTLPKLAPCPDCEHQISVKAFVCPQCGCPMPHLAEIAKVYPHEAGNGWRFRSDPDGTIAVFTEYGVESRYKRKDFERIVKQHQQSGQQRPGWWFGISFPI